MLKRFALCIPLIPSILYGSAAIYFHEKMEGIGTFVAIRSYAATAVLITCALQLLMTNTLFSPVVHSSDYYEKCVTFGLLMTMGDLVYFWVTKTYSPSVSAVSLAAVPIVALVWEAVQKKEIFVGELLLVISFMVSVVLYLNMDKMHSWGKISWK